MKVWKWWILVVLAVSGPWYGVVRAPQWSRVTWIPFRGAEDKPRDVAANFLLFLPFGLSFAGGARGRTGIAASALAAAAVSLPVETAQLFFRLRDPSATDVLMAALGSAAGSLAAQAFQWSDTRRTARGYETREARGEQ